VIPARVSYARPTTIEQAIDLLSESDAKLLAGGHSLVPMMKLRLARPGLLVDIGRLELRGVGAEDGLVEIGALTTYDELTSRSPDQIPDALREGAAAVGDVQVRNRGTLGGGIAHADPAGDCAASLIALGARVRLQSGEGTRECVAEDFFRGPFSTVLGLDEIIVSLRLARPRDGEGSAYYATADPASGYPLAGVAVRVAHNGDRVVGATVGLTGAAAAPCRLPAVEQALAGGGEGLGDAVRSAVADIRLSHGGGNVRYRRQLVHVAILRAFESARARAQGLRSS
jgi:carbon-monoxide dehydrogenase medium subunit